MNTAKSIAALMLVIASSSALAEGGSDRLHGKMIQANEQAMRAYAAAAQSGSIDIPQRFIAFT